MSAPPRAAPPRAHATYARSSELVSRRADTPTPHPLVLQQRARQALRRHGGRDALRVGVLLAADLLTLLFAHLALNAVADQRILGGGMAALARVVIPPGQLPASELTAAVIVGLCVIGTYRHGDSRRDPRRLLAAASLGVGLLSWSRLWSGFQPAMILSACAVAIGLGALLIVERLAVDAVVTWFRRAARLGGRVLLVGAPEAVRTTAQYPSLADEAAYNVIGFADTSESPAAEALGRVDDLVDLIDRHRIDTIVLAAELPPAVTRTVLNIADAAGCAIFAIPSCFELPETAPRILSERGSPLVLLARPGLQWHQRLVKRGLDVVVASALLVVLAPLLLAVAVAVRLTSAGPVFFRQERVGLGGRLFRIFKFRSMAADAEAHREELMGDSVYGDARLFKMRGDPRVTRLGGWLRKSSVDELPQLLNVVRGEMSLVGPRPPLPSEVALYEDHHFTRFVVAPGITGPWQVRGRNRVTDFDEVVRLETAYIRRWRLRKDLHILAQTVPAVLKMDGAY